MASSSPGHLCVARDITSPLDMDDSYTEAFVALCLPLGCGSILSKYHMIQHRTPARALYGRCGVVSH